MTEILRLSLVEAYGIAYDALARNGFAHDHADAIARSVAASERDGCHSHGLYRVLVCVRTARSGMVELAARPHIEDISPALLRADARYAFSQVTFDMAAERLVEKANHTGVAALAINHCYHFSALWQEVERLATMGVAALAMNPTTACVAPSGGTRPLLGTNPLAFAWPRLSGEPYVFDFATSMIARGDIELAARAGTRIPPDWAVNSLGEPTEDPAQALAGAMLTFGGHKGSALSTMIELLAGPLLGDLLSSESSARDAGMRLTPCHGELILAFSPAAFCGGNARSSLERAEKLFNAMTDQGARLPSARRYAARAKAIAEGLAVPRSLLQEIALI